MVRLLGGEDLSKRNNIPTNDEVSEYVGVEPKDRKMTIPSREGIRHKPDSKEDLYNRRMRRSKQHI